MEEGRGGMTVKLAFISNYYNHHQSSLCEAWDRITEHRFAFIQTQPFSQERREKGWTEAKHVPFAMAYGEMGTEDTARFIDACETVILGDAPLGTVGNRLKSRDVVFKYSERICKRGFRPVKWLPRFARFWYRYGRRRSLYLLSAGAYAARDFAIHGALAGKSYRWGYFPETRRYDTDALLNCKNPRKMLWCGRFLDWKHPDDALSVAKRLKEEGYAFELEMIGAGGMLPAIRESIEEEGLSGCVHLSGAMSPGDVRARMERAGVFLFTSDFQEGWGVVLNEAMNSGCAVVASHAAGAVPYLIRHQENGLIYQSGDIDGLYMQAKALLDSPGMQRTLGTQAYHTITELWNAEVAAERLLHLAQEIREHGRCDLYQDGPCSRAPMIRDDWFKGRGRHDIQGTADETALVSREQRIRRNGAF